MTTLSLRLVPLWLALGCGADATFTRIAPQPASTIASSAGAPATPATASASASATPVASAAPRPSAVSTVSTKLADASGDSFFVLDEAPLPPLKDKSSFMPLQDGYALVKEGTSNVKVQRLSAFSDKPTPLFTLPGKAGHWGPRADPAGQQIAALVHHPLGIGFMNADLYVWSQAKGLRRLLTGTVQTSLRADTLSWSPDGQYVVIESYAKDCPAREGTQRCSRMLLVDVTSGEIAYRTPAGLAARGAHWETGRLFIVADRDGRPVEVATTGLGSLASDSGYWELAPNTHELSASPGINYDSPDGHYHLQQYSVPHLAYPATRVEAKDGSVAYSLNWFTFMPIWLGPHLLGLSDVALDLETKSLRPIAPDGFKLAARSFDGKSALVYRRVENGPLEYRWAKPRN